MHFYWKTSWCWQMEWLKFGNWDCSIAGVQTSPQSSRITDEKNLESHQTAQILQNVRKVLLALTYWRQVVRVAFKGFVSWEQDCLIIVRVGFREFVSWEQDCLIIVHVAFKGFVSWEQDCLIIVHVAFKAFVSWEQDCLSIARVAFKGFASWEQECLVIISWFSLPYEKLFGKLEQWWLIAGLSS